MQRDIEDSFSKLTLLICWLDYHHHNLFKDKLRTSLLVVRKESDLKNNSKNTYVLTALNKFALITKIKVRLRFNERDIDEIINNLEPERQIQTLIKIFNISTYETKCLII